MIDARQMALFESRRERDRILRAMAENHFVYLEGLRSFAREHALRNPHLLVTIDDVLRIMAARDWPQPSEIGADNRILGTVFTRKEFEPVGRRPTERAERIARSGRARGDITVYRLRETHEEAMTPRKEVA
jgi:hypothetical protein